MDEHDLYHYGVIGMKWGVRRNPSKSFAKASGRADKLRTKSVNTAVKAAKLQKKALKKEASATSEKQYQKAREIQFKANKLNLKSAKLSKKADKWIKSMDKTFSEVKVSDISQEHLDAGKKYAYMLMKDNK